MKCPCCGAELALVSAAPVVPVGVSDVVEPLFTPSPAPQESHDCLEIRWAVKCIKGADKRLFFQNGEINWAKSLTGRLFVRVGSYWAPVRHWADVVDRKGVPFLVEP